MSLSRESVVSLLVSAGGGVSKAELLESFRGALECDDRHERARNRELFKRLVNSVAYVRRGDDGAPYVLLKKAYQQPRGTQQDLGQTAGREQGGTQEEPPESVVDTKRYAGQEEGGSPQKGEQGLPETGRCCGQEQEGEHEHEHYAPETATCVATVLNTKKLPRQERDQSPPKKEPRQFETVVNVQGSERQEQTCGPQQGSSENVLDLKSHAEQEQEVERLDQVHPGTVVHLKRHAGHQQEGDPEQCCPEQKQENCLQTGDLEQGPSETGVIAKRHAGREQECKQKEKNLKRSAGKEEEDTLQTGDQGQCLPGSAGDSKSRAKSEQGRTEHLSPFELALQRSKCFDMSVKQRQNADVGPKPYALPLRMPPMNRTQAPKQEPDLDKSPKADPFRSKAKTAKASDETRIPSAVPLEPSEHEWLVKCASGHWSQVYGLLLRDRQLADKRDFMSGFTALHWAAKCGNSEMLVKILDTSQEASAAVDVNARTYGGYTALHVAALHRQDYVVAMLVGEYGADVRVRDNGGKRAYHYLHPDAAQSIRDMLGEPKYQRAPHRPEEPEMFPELSKGLHSISRLFQPHLSAQRKKHKHRPAFYSLGDQPQEQRHDKAFRQRLASDAFA
ncbi:ankyrin repeat domain-containing protein SOWAHB-like [Syngnathoides biaculeatus]|uniref:ankyrin repeat domain-containing protein SOWAHB-like n=1 Tax=Syngnathoides biaculeatus TaxID=300417 RepID=UPI002ADDA5CB|nr:ankyrin repeat domain-containing protein SOWAHB-like [Syngnathoides biaculeatus]